MNRVAINHRLLIDQSPDLVTIRTNVLLTQHVSSMTYSNDVFYWINNGVAVAEEYNANDHKYVQNAYLPKTNEEYTDMVLYGVTTQPIPQPRAPVQHLQVLFDSSSAHVHWQPPPNIPQRGISIELISAMLASHDYFL